MSGRKSCENQRRKVAWKDVKGSHALARQQGSCCSLFLSVFGLRARKGETKNKHKEEGKTPDTRKTEFLTSSRGVLGTQ